MVSSLKKTIKGFFLCISFLVTLWNLGFLFFLCIIVPRPQANNTPTDAIVVLTGDNHRLEEGYKLLEKRLSTRLLISGVDRFLTVKSLINLSPFLTSVERKAALANTDRITLGYTALNTLGNAQETAQWVRKNGIRSLRLVTHGYHMPRALLIFHQVLPSVTIVAHSISSEGDWKIIAREYTKYLLTRAHTLLSSTH